MARGLPLKHRKRRGSPDGIDWRDPDMPVVTKEHKLIDPKRKQWYAQLGMSFGAGENWRDDPTYDLKKK